MPTLSVSPAAVLSELTVMDEDVKGRPSILSRPDNPEDREAEASSIEMVSLVAVPSITTEPVTMLKIITPAVLELCYLIKRSIAATISSILAKTLTSAVLNTSLNPIKVLFRHLLSSRTKDPMQEVHVVGEPLQLRQGEIQGMQVPSFVSASKVNLSLHS